MHLWCISRVALPWCLSWERPKVHGGFTSPGQVAVPSPMGNEAEKEECSVCFPQETHSWTTLQRAVLCGHAGIPDRRREALDPTAPSLILGELMFNTTAENYLSPSQQQVFRGITQCFVLLPAGECCSQCGTYPDPHITFCVCTLVQLQEKKKHFTSSGRSKLLSALLLFSSMSFTSSVC